jgi:predicted nucleotidyltransferase
VKSISRDKLKGIKDIIIKVLKKHNVKKAAIFGSVARGEATEESDIDIVIEFEGRKSLLDLVDLKLELQELLGKKVDVITYNSINPLLKEQILNEQKILL